MNSGRNSVPLNMPSIRSRASAVTATSAGRTRSNSRTLSSTAGRSLSSNSSHALTNPSKHPSPTPATLSKVTGPQRYTYGSDPNQFAELHLPVGQQQPGVVVIVHGGFWRSRYTLELGTPLAEDLSSRGFACWNLEYRRVGNGGGWPESFQDVAAGIDLLAFAAREHGLNTSTTTALGHSAGGHLAVWAAGRPSLPPDAPGGGVPTVPITGVVSQSGVLNLQRAREERLGNGAVQDFLGEPDGEKYRLADPMSVVPLSVPVLALHGEEDSTVPLSQSQSYVDAAVAEGATAEVIRIPGDHYAMITPGTDAWASVVTAIERLT